jgi:hypothetical protein
VLSGVWTAACVALLPIVARRLGFSRAAGVIAGVILAIPTFVWFETNARWEAPFAAGALVFCVAASMPALRTGSARPFGAFVHGVSWGLGILVSPLLMLAYAAMHVVAFVQHRTPRFGRYVLGSAMGLALVVGPYVAYQSRQLHGLTFVRSNFGLELWIANNDRAHVSFDENVKPGGPFDSHPFFSVPEARRVGAMGELAYNRMRLRDAVAWIRAHPSRFADLTIRRVGRLVVPPFSSVRQRLVFGAIVIGALLALVRLAMHRRREATLLASALAGYFVVLPVIQSDPRYTYPVLWLSAVVAATLFVPSEGAERRSRGIPEA